MRTWPSSPRLYISAAKGFFGLCELTDMPCVSPEPAAVMYTRVRAIMYTTSSNNKVNLYIGGPLYIKTCEKQPREDWPTKESYSRQRDVSLLSIIGRPMEPSEEWWQDSMFERASKVLGVSTIKQLTSKSSTCTGMGSERLSWIRVTDLSSAEKNSR